MPSRRFQRSTRAATLLGLLLATAFLGGCGIFSPEQPKEVETKPIEPYPLALTENQLVQNFIDAHNDRNFQEYDLLLHDDFEFHFADKDVDPGRGIPLFWDRQADVSSTQAMFSGQPGKLDGEGVQQAPVQSINLSLSPRGVWTAAGIPSEYESEKVREYDVVMTVNYDNGDIAQVTGFQQFYVKRVTLENGTQVWKLRVWRDTGNPNDDGGKVPVGPGA